MEQKTLLWSVLVIIIISAGILFVLAFYNTANAPTEPGVNVELSGQTPTGSEQTFRTLSTDE